MRPPYEYLKARPRNFSSEKFACQKGEHDGRGQREVIDEAADEHSRVNQKACYQEECRNEQCGRKESQFFFCRLVLRRLVEG
jgi:hypothetical protein